MMDVAGTVKLGKPGQVMTTLISHIVSRKYPWPIVRTIQCSGIGRDGSDVPADAISLMAFTQANLRGDSRRPMGHELHGQRAHRIWRSARVRLRGTASGMRVIISTSWDLLKNTELDSSLPAVPMT
jgi:hypothetical protein